jgi:hypothetical protein
MITIFNKFAFQYYLDEPANGDIQSLEAQLRQLTDRSKNDHFDQIFLSLCSQDDMESQQTMDLESQLKAMVKEGEERNFDALIGRLPETIRIQRGL